MSQARGKTRRQRSNSLYEQGLAWHAKPSDKRLRKVALNSFLFSYVVVGLCFHTNSRFRRPCNGFLQALTDFDEAVREGRPQ